MTRVDAFLTRLAKVIRDEHLLPARATILVAVSGGLDSMALLTALARLSATFRWRLVAAHFNHRLRGRAADADERFVQRQCASLQLPCHVGRWIREAQAAAIKSGGVEHAARGARLTFLGLLARDLGAKHVVVAHHADDQVEHFFVRLLRGAGSHGLGGMRRRSKHGPPLGAWLVRPLLDFPRSDLARWVRANGIKFREDASNRDRRFVRNRVRHELLPYLSRNFSPAIHRLVLRTMQGLAGESDWQRQAAAAYLRTPNATRQPFGKCPPALQRHALALQLERRGLKFDWDLIEALRTAADTTVIGPGNHGLARDRLGNLTVSVAQVPVFEPAAKTVALAASNGAFDFASLTVRWSMRRHRKPVRFLPRQELFDAATIGDRIVLRHWQPGDRFQPIGMPRPVKLQDLFTNAKVPAAERRRRVVATTARGEIFWVEGLRIGGPFKLTPETQRCLVWRVQRRRRPGPLSPGEAPR